MTPADFVIIWAGLVALFLYLLSGLGRHNIVTSEVPPSSALGDRTDDTATRVATPPKEQPASRTIAVGGER